MTLRDIKDEDLASLVPTCTSVQDMLRKLGIRLAGGTHKQLTIRLAKAGIDTSHFKKGLQGKTHPRRSRSEDILVVLPPGSNRQKSHKLRRALLSSGIEEKCSSCSTGTLWNGKSLRLEIDHIDGNWLDNRIHNLRFMCPNCHSQTPTYKSKNIGELTQTALSTGLNPVGT